MGDSGGVTDWKAVGARIRELREGRGLTQSQLGVVVGSSANYVTKVEGGLGISDTKLDAYATALGVSVPFLRYGVAGGPEDVANAREIGRVEGRREILRDVQEWAAQFVAERAVPPSEPVHPARISVVPETKRAQRPSILGSGESA